MFGRRKDMRKKNIARAGAAFVLLLALTGVTILGQDAEATSRAETPRKVVSVSKTKNIKKSDSEDIEKKSEEKQSAEASSKVEQEKQSEDKKQETEKESATAIENKSESNSSQNDSNSENQNKSENSSEKSTESTQPSHEHTWIPQKKGYEKKTLVKEAWTEYKPIYETVAIEVCGNCGADCTSDPAGHIKEHMLNGTGQYGTHTEYVPKQTGTEEIPHEAEYKTEWIEDIIGHKCSSCGATK